MIQRRSRPWLVTRRRKEVNHAPAQPVSTIYSAHWSRRSDPPFLEHPPLQSHHKQSCTTQSLLLRHTLHPFAMALRRELAPGQRAPPAKKCHNCQKHQGDFLRKSRQPIALSLGLHEPEQATVAIHRRGEECRFVVRTQLRSFPADDRRTRGLLASTSEPTWQTQYNQWEPLARPVSTNTPPPSLDPSP